MTHLWLDTETTGTDPNKNCIIQLAGVLGVNGKTVTKFNITCAPPAHREINPEALAVHGITEEQFSAYQTVRAAHAGLVSHLAPHIDKFNPADKAFICGYNAMFDKNFLYEFFKDAGDKFFGSWFRYQVFDVFAIAQALVATGTLPTPDKKGDTVPGKSLKSLKLADVCWFLSVPLGDAHDAMADILATVRVAAKFKENGWLPK